MNNKTRFALYVDEAVLDEARELCQDESISSFIEKSIHFYCGYLRAESAENYLPPLFRKYLMTGIEYFCDRIGRLMYKMAVETNITNRLLADDVDMSFKDGARRGTSCTPSRTSAPPRRSGIGTISGFISFRGWGRSSWQS